MTRTQLLSCVLFFQGTEPPAPTHKKPVQDPPSDPKQHEEGEIEVKPNVWEFPVAQTKKGLLWGTIEESRGSKRILAFRGIQYVKPPIGPLRWKPPVPSPGKIFFTFINFRVTLKIKKNELHFTTFSNFSNVNTCIFKKS